MPRREALGSLSGHRPAVPRHRARVYPEAVNGFQQTTPVRLRRVVGPVEATLSGVGIILGAGIYALIGAVAEKAGNALWLSFLISGTMAAVIGICYAELASMFPSAGADYEYTRQAAGPRAAFVIGWLIVIANLVGAATVALGFSYYFNTFWRAGIVEVAAVVLVCATLVAFVGIRQAIWVSILLTLVEAAGLVTVIRWLVSVMAPCHGQGPSSP